MRFSAALVVLSAAFATSSAALLESRQSGYASCALPCLTQTNPGSCSLSDTACLCHNDQFVKATTACFEANCSGNDLEQSIDAAIAMCRSVGVTLSSSIPIPTATSASSPGSTTTTTAKNAGASNGVNAVFALSAFGLIAYAL